MCVCVCDGGEVFGELKLTQEAAAFHDNPSSLEPPETWRLLSFSCWNFALLSSVSIPLIRNPELNSLHAHSTLPLAGSPRLSLANPGGKRLIPWTGVRDALEQLVHSLARLHFCTAVAGTAYACSWTLQAIHFTGWFEPRAPCIPLVTGA